MNETAGITHIAGPVIQWNDKRLGPVVRQRCSWCGAALINVELRSTGVVVSDEHQDTSYPTWPVGAQVTVDGGMSFVLAEETHPEFPGQVRPPANACLMLDPQVTL